MENIVFLLQPSVHISGHPELFEGTIAYRTRKKFIALPNSIEVPVSFLDVARNDTNLQISKSSNLKNMTLTYILIGLNVAISLYAWKSPDFMQAWVFHPYTVKRNNQWYRFLTSGF